MVRDINQKIFISYAREDEQWMKIVRNTLSAQQDFNIDHWNDLEEIRSGEAIDPKINQAIAECDVGLFLISQDFLGSDYVTRIELPKFREKRKKDNNVLLIPVLMDDVCSKDLVTLKLDSVLAAVDWKDPLPKDVNTYNEKERHERAESIVHNIRRAIDPTLAAFELLPEAASYQIEMCFSRNPETNLYYATEKGTGRKVVIKAFNEWGKRRRVYRSLEALGKMDGPNVVPLLSSQLQKKPPYYITRRIPGPTLREYINLSGWASSERVQTILLKLGKALQHLRTKSELSHFFFDIRPSHVMLDSTDQQPYLIPTGLHIPRRGNSFVKWLDENLESLGDAEVCEVKAYLIPEFFGARSCIVNRDLTDQYLLGMLGYHMMMGCPSDQLYRFNNLSELEQPRIKWKALEDMREVRGGKFEHLIGVIRRMTAIKPEHRFPSLEEALHSLENPSLYSLGEVRASYQRCLKNSDGDVFFRLFYRKFFERCPEAEKLFARLGKPDVSKRWVRQRAMVRHAVLLLLVHFEQKTRNAGPGDPVWTQTTSADVDDLSVLQYPAKFHREKMGNTIQSDWFQDFIEALAETAGIVDQDSNYLCEQSERVEFWTEVLKPGKDFIASGFSHCHANILH